MLSTARQLQEKYQEQNQDLFMTFVDITKTVAKGSVLSRANRRLMMMPIGDEATVNTAKVRVAFGILRGNICERNGIRRDTKLKVYKAVILSTLLFARGAWTLFTNVLPRDIH